MVKEDAAIDETKLRGPDCGIAVSDMGEGWRWEKTSGSTRWVGLERWDEMRSMAGIKYPFTAKLPQAGPGEKVRYLGHMDEEEVGQMELGWQGWHLDPFEMEALPPLP